MREALLHATYDSLTEEEFEANWLVVLNKYKLQDHNWLKGLYRDKDMWVPAFLKHLFRADMKMTQRVESIRSFFDDYLKKHTRLYEFAESYCKAMECRTEEYRQFDAHFQACTWQIVHGFTTQHVFQRCYADLKFKEVLRECSRICHLHCFNKVVISNSVMEY